jgi:hypothetical protein
MRSGDMVTFRQWSVDNKFKYPIDFSDPALAASVACVELHGTPFGNDLYMQFSLKALDVLAGTNECNWTFEFKDPENGDFLRLNFHVKPFEGCSACPLGEQHKSTTDCDCEPMPTEPVFGHLYTAHHYDANTEHTVEMRSGDMVTFRQWSVDNKFKYPIDFSDPALAASVACVGLHGTPFGNELYMQFSLKALDIAADAPDCTWTFEFKDPDNGDFLRLNFVVKY